MPNLEAVYLQANFLGGEWGPLSQGRSDLVAYKSAMNVSLNGLAVEEGAWVRRSGTQYIGPTAGRGPAKLLPFQTRDGQGITMEFTSGALQFYAGSGYVCTNDRRTITASHMNLGALELTLDATHGWSYNDAVVLVIPIAQATAGSSPYRNRIYKIAAVPDTDKLVLVDDLGADLTLTSLDDALVDCKVLRLKRFSTSWTSNINSIRRVQAQEDCIILHNAVAPQLISVTTEETGDEAPVFSALSAVSFVDGPYLDSQKVSGVNETATVSAYTGTITVTPATTDPSTADIGRHIRLWSEPAEWDSATTYTYGQTAKYNGEWWVSIAAGTYASSNVNVVPGTLATVGTSAAVLWAPSVDAGRWAWGTITAVSAGTTYTVALVTALNSANGTTVTEWRLGLFKADQYPTCGAYHDGRLWLAGAIGNRLDVSTATDKYTFSPSDPAGVVTDAHAINASLNFDELVTIRWMVSDDRGVTLGTEGGQVLVTASQLDDVFTPWSRQAKKAARYRCANIDPARTATTIVFAEKTKRRLVEYFPENLSSRASGLPLNDKSRHLSLNGIAEIVYQTEPVPVIWIRDEEGQLSGITYRRTSLTVSAPPEFTAAHRHEISDGSRVVASMCVGIDNSELYELLYLVTCLPDGTDCAVEILRPTLTED